MLISSHAGTPPSAGAPDGAPDGTPDGELCRFGHGERDEAELAAVELADRVHEGRGAFLKGSRRPGRSPGRSVPAAATAADTEPAGTSSAFSCPFDRPLITGLPPASTSTVGAAAVCRTTSRACPAGTDDTSFTTG